MTGLSKDKHYILGCSGGPDSMALLHMLIIDNINFDVAFVNYHKRKESVLEEEGVREYCIKHNIKFHLLSTKNEMVKGNFQAWARTYRYEFFYKLAKLNNSEGILIAHHLDDLLETYIFQKRRKGIYQTYGLSRKSFYKDQKVIRPLLNYRKKELEDYCIKNSVPYFIDSSNLKDEYTRNKIRHAYIEKLSKSEIKELVFEIKEKNKENKQKNKESFKFLKQKNYDISSFLLLDKDIQQRIVYYLVSYYKIVNGREITAIIEFLSSPGNGEIRLKKDIYLFKEYGTFKIAKKLNDYEYIINQPIVFDSKEVYIDLINGSKVLFIKDNPYPLKVCNCKKDEYVKIGNIHKKVNRLFVDEKISPSLRKSWPCIKDKNDKIIYFPRKNEERQDGLVVFKVKNS